MTTTTNPNTLDDIETRRTALVTELRTLVETAGDDDLEGDDAARYTEIEGELETLKSRRDRLELLARHAPAGTNGSGANGLEGFNQTRTTDPYDITDRRLVGDEVKGRARDAVEQTRDLDDSHKARATELLETIDTEQGVLARHIVATGRPEYRSGFLKLAAGQDWAITNEERAAIVEARAASLTNTAGGYAVPFTLDPTLIITNAGTNNPIRRISSVRSIVTNSWNGVNTAGITASWDAEAAAVSDDTPTLGQPSIPVYKGQAFVPFSVEIGDDWASIESDLRAAFADSRDRLEATAFTTGTGSAQPTGIITSLVGVSGSIQNSATTDTYAVADVYATQEKCAPRFRSNGSWLMNLAIINKTRQFATTAGSAFLTDLAGGVPPQLLGRPLYECSDMDGTLTGSAENYVAVFGDFANYRIIDRVGFTAELVPHLFDTSTGRPTGQRGMLAWWRTGADSVNDAAFCMLDVT